MGCGMTDRSGSDLRTRKIDPLQTFKTGPVKEREARESGLCPKAWVAPRAVGSMMPDKDAQADLHDGQAMNRDRAASHRGLHAAAAVQLPGSQA